MTSLTRRTATIAFVKDICKKLPETFTIDDITEAMHGKRYNYPTTKELHYLLPRVGFIEIVGREKGRYGTITHYKFAENGGAKA